MSLALATSRGMWKYAPHLGLLNKKALSLASRRSKRVLLTMPPRHGKSSFINYLARWWLGNFPDQRVILLSYGAELANHWSNKTRLFLEEWGPPLFNIKVYGSSTGWGIEGREGGMRAAGVGGPITGFGADLLIADDLIKNAEEAASPTVREHTWDWWLSTAYSRLEPNGVAVMIATRWHRDDPIGRILEQQRLDPEMEKWELFNLPAVAEEDEPAWPEGMGRKVGEPLWPYRFDTDRLKEIRKVHGEYWWSALYQQRPTPMGGGMFKEHYFNQRTKAAPYQARRVRYWDRASTADGGCYTAGVLMAEYEGNYYIEDVVHGQWEPDERNARILAAAQRDRSKYGPKYAPTILVEAEGGSSGKDSFKALAKVLAGFPVKEDRVTGAKDVRAEPWSAQCAAGNVYLVDNGQKDGTGLPLWDIVSFTTEHCLFKMEPGTKRLGKYKDQVDAASAAFSFLLKGRSSPVFRTFTLGTKKAKFHIVIGSGDDLSTMQTDHKAILITFVDPPTDQGLVMPPSPHGFTNMLDKHQVFIADIQPSEYIDTWEEVLPPYNQKPEKLVLDRENGKKLWAFLLKKRETQPDLFVFQDNGGEDRRAHSVALAVADTMGLPRSVIHMPADTERFSTADNSKSEKPGNVHLYDMVRATRGMVM